MGVSGIALWASCAGNAPATPAAGSGDAAYRALATEILEDFYKRNPTHSTDLGIHTYDAELDDYSAEAVTAEAQAAKAFKTRLEAVDPATLTLDAQLDRDELLHVMDSTVLGDEVIRMWAKDPDRYAAA